jgi:hypothetical protein
MSGFSFLLRFRFLIIIIMILDLYFLIQKFNMSSYRAIEDKGRKNGGPCLNDSSPTSAKFKKGLFVRLHNSLAQLSYEIIKSSSQFMMQKTKFIHCRTKKLIDCF